IEPRGEPLGDDAGVGRAVRRRIDQLLLQRTDVLSEFHATIVTPQWCHVKRMWCRGCRLRLRGRSATVAGTLSCQSLAGVGRISYGGREGKPSLRGTQRG